MDFENANKNVLISRLTEEETKMLKLFNALSEDKQKQALKLINNALYADFSKEQQQFTL